LDDLEGGTATGTVENIGRSGCSLATPELSCYLVLCCVL